MRFTTLQAGPVRRRLAVVVFHAAVHGRDYLGVASPLADPVPAYYFSTAVVFFFALSGLRPRPPAPVGDARWVPPRAGSFAFIRRIWLTACERNCGPRVGGRHPMPGDAKGPVAGVHSVAGRPEPGRVLGRHRVDAGVRSVPVDRADPIRRSAAAGVSVSARLSG